MEILKLPKIIGHRGASGLAPENTLAALQKAYDLGARWVECDVMLTQDNVPIIFHDTFLDRTTNGRGRVARKDYGYITSLDAGSWFSPEFTGEKIPSLAEWLSLAARLKIGLNLELKVKNRKKSAILAELVLLHLDKYWNKDLPRPLISSFYRYNLAAIYSRSEQHYLGFILSQWTSNWQRICQRYNCVSVHFNHHRLTAQRIAFIKKMGLQVLAYTVDHPLRAQQLFAWGVDAIFSNNLELLKCDFP